MDVDYYNKESKIREILDILRPPVRRVCKNSHENYIGYVLTEDKEKREKASFEQNKCNKKHSQQTARPSLSLVLQKTCKKQIIKEYPFANNTLETEDQTEETSIAPTIKVTVIPKKDPNGLLKFLETNNQSNTINTNKKTSQNVENSIATKNVYLVVAGTKKDKIYELKTIDNKTLKNNKHKDVKVDSRRFQSKMEKKKKRSVNLEGKHDQEKCTDPNCFCRCLKDDLDLSLEDDYPIGSSRVRIVGRIGLNEEDKYVMKCEATVNGEPVANYVPSYVAQLPIPMKPERKYNTKRESKTEKIPSMLIPTLVDGKFIESMNGSTISHATQVDASMQLRRFCSTIDKNTQCNLCELCNHAENSNFDDESKVTNLNRSTSPFLIISVYPKPELNTYAINTETASVNRCDIQAYRPPEINETARSNNFTLNTDMYNVRESYPNKINRPRCCPCETITKNDTKTAKEFNSKNSDTNTARAHKASRSPSPTKKSPKPKIQERRKDSPDTKKTAKSKSRSPSPNRIGKNDKTTQKDISLSKQQTKKVEISTKRADTRKVNETTKSKLNPREKNISAVKERPDKTRKVTENKKKNVPKHIMIKNDERSAYRESVLQKTFPKNDISKVSINIDSDREYYDVVFEKGAVSTGVKVKRTAKDINRSPKYFEEMFENDYENNEERVSDSLENFFTMTEAGERKRSASQTFDNENNDAFPLAPNLSRLNVRDSLEINHRREHEHARESETRASKDSFENYIDGDIGKDFYAPVKHFPGDNCCIVDPIKRDREIRELLGVDKKRQKPKSKTHVDSLENETYKNNVFLRRCICANTLCKSLVKKPNGSNSNCTKNILNGYLDNKCISRDEDKSITDDEKRNLIYLSYGSSKQTKMRNVNQENKVQITAKTKQQSTQYIDNEMLQLHCFSKGTTTQQPHKKQTTILLSGQQYRKMKKVMYKANADKKKWRHVWNSSMVSLGSVRAKRRSDYIIHYNRDVQTDLNLKDPERSKLKTSMPKNIENNKTIILYSKEKNDENNGVMRNEVRKIASSVEIRYASFAYSNKGQHSMEQTPRVIKYRSNLVWNRHDSIETIFKGHKKSYTPNLGTSSLSLLSEEVKSTAESLPTETKPRKPFLRRLMSCLVMRSETTPIKAPVVVKQPPATLESSVDSYHISTSLGAMDMSSSIYDTSASFYSNHTIGIINSKNKKGFFSSVRGFLSAKKY